MADLLLISISIGEMADDAYRGKELPLVRFHKGQTDRIIAHINASGAAYFGGTVWRGERCMRVSVCNWLTSESDIERAIAAAKTALATL